MRKWAAVLLAGAIGSAPGVANAFLLLGKGKDAPAKQTSVAMLREGRDTALSIVTRVRDDAGEVVLLVPVPAGAETKTLSLDALAALSRVTQPRIDEYWEADPCEFHPPTAPPTPMPDASSSAGSSANAAPSASAATSSSAAATSSAKAAPSGSSVPSASASASGAPDAGPPSYAVELFGGKAAELVASLKKDGYTLPTGTEAALATYLDAGMKIAVAKIDAAKATSLPPLFLHYVTDDPTLPTRLFALGGKSSLDVYTIAPRDRFEAKDQPNVAVPTNLDVGSFARSKLPKLYGAIIDKTFEKKAGAVITEYAWRASTCELCTAPLTAAEVAPLGLDVLPSAKAGKQGEVLVDAEKVASRPDGPDALRTSLQACYQKALASKPGLGGKVVVDVEVANGAVTTAKVEGSPDAALADCATSAAKTSGLERTGAMAVDFAPISRKFFADLALTKLRARFDGVPEKDLTLRAAKAIEGGRELGPEGKPEKKVYWASSGNDFQARYVVRHKWKGKPKCQNPERDVWGGKPDGWKADAAPAGDPGLDVIDGGLPALDAYVIAYAEPAPPPPEPTPPPAPSVSPSAGPMPAPSGSAAPAPSASPNGDDSGCGCRIVDAREGERGAPGAMLLFGAALLARVRRTRSAASL